MICLCIDPFGVFLLFGSASSWEAESTSIYLSSVRAEIFSCPLVPVRLWSGATTRPGADRKQQSEASARVIQLR